MVQWDEIAKVVVPSIASFFAGWFVFRNKKQDGDRVSFQLMLTDYKDQVDKLRLEVMSLSEKVELLTIDRDYFRNQLTLLLAAHSDDPFPRWTKDADGRMIHVSKGYEEMFLKPLGKTALDYAGKTDDEIWGEITGSKFRQHDEYVKRTGDMWIGFESHIVDGEDMLKNWYFVKTPLFIKGTSTFLGTEGRAIPLPEEIHRLISKRKKPATKS